MATNQSHPSKVDCHKLLLAALKGNWEDAKKLLEAHTELITKVICNRNGMNALHVACANGQTKFVEKMVQFMIDKRGQVSASMDGDIRAFRFDKCMRGGYSALHLAAMGGHLKMAKALIRGDQELTQLTDANQDTPLLCALKFFSKYKLVRYLALVTKAEDPGPPLTDQSKAGDLMVHLTHMGFHDISLYLIGRDEKVRREQSLERQSKNSLALAKNEHNETILTVLAYEPANFYSGTKLNFWQRWIYSLIPVHDSDLELKTLSSDDYVAAAPGVNTVRKQKLRHKRACKLVDHCLTALLECCNEKQQAEYFKEQKILRLAARYGTVEIVTASLHYFPDLIFSKSGPMLLKDAIEGRQEKMFNLICKTTALDKLLASMCLIDMEQDASNCTGADKQQDPSERVKYEYTSPSHLAAELPTISRSSYFTGAAQMQREMQWYKAVERIQHPRAMELAANEEGETAFDIFSKNRKEMREDAEEWMKDTSNSSVVVSALIATVAFAAAFAVPGGTNDEGYPIFLNQTSFKVFICADALALFSSVTSTLMFLSIQTSSYKEEDFLRALPQRMILGLFFLFLALAAILVSFGAGVALMLSHWYKWVLGAVPLIIPVFLFVMLQLPLFVEMCESTYAARFHPEKIWKRD